MSNTDWLDNMYTCAQDTEINGGHRLCEHIKETILAEIDKEKTALANKIQPEVKKSSYMQVKALLDLGWSADEVNDWLDKQLTKSGIEKGKKDE